MAWQAVTLPERCGRSVRFVEGTQPVPGRAPVTAGIVARLASPMTATVLGALVLAELIAALVLEGLDHQLTWSLAVIEPSCLLVFAGVGVVVARRRPRNPVGWILIVFSVLIVLAVAAGLYAVVCYRLGHRGLPLAAAAVALPVAALEAALEAAPVAVLDDAAVEPPELLELQPAAASAMAAMTAAPIGLRCFMGISSLTRFSGWLSLVVAWVRRRSRRGSSRPAAPAVGRARRRGPRG